MTIGIGGISRSGKSTLASLIQRYFTVEARNPDSFGKGGQTAIILAQDDYVFPTEQIPKIKHNADVEIDWETPESIDFQRYRKAILTAQLQFDDVITEGLFNFYAEDINCLFDKFFFVNISKITFLRRKALDKRWSEVPAWYIEHIWMSYERFGRTILDDKKKEVLILSGEVDFDLNIVTDFLKKCRN